MGFDLGIYDTSKCRFAAGNEKLCNAHTYACWAGLRFLQGPAVFPSLNIVWCFRIWVNPRNRWQRHNVILDYTRTGHPGVPEWQACLGLTRHNDWSSQVCLHLTSAELVLGPLVACQAVAKKTRTHIFQHETLYFSTRPCTISGLALLPLSVTPPGLASLPTHFAALPKGLKIKRKVNNLRIDNIVLTYALE